MSEVKVNSIKGVGASVPAISINNTDGTCTANITNNLSNRNLIINGAMQVAQRGTPLTVNANLARGKTCADLWEISSDTNGTAVFSSSKSTDTPNGFGSSLKLDVTTADTSIAADVGTRFLQRFEGQNLQAFKKGSSDALQFTLSFYVKSPKTGTHCIELLDIDNNRSVSATYTISQADTWQYVTNTFPADTTGALDNDNAQSFIVLWWLAAGSNYSSGTLNTTWNARVEANRAVGQVNVTDNTANNFYITGVQLEVGSTATEFEHRSFGQELALCQRYLYITNGGGCGVGVGGGSNAVHRCQMNLPVTMRAAPSVTMNGSTMHTYDGANSAYFNGFAAVHSTNQAIDWETSDSERTAGSVTAYRPVIAYINSSSGGVICSAEL
jgi:hypothetical protein